jgi:hypothetical protein
MKRTHRKKELTEVQTLKKENRELRTQVRDLKKQVRQLQKQEHFHENTKLDEEAEQMMFDIEPIIPKCPGCSRPGLTEINVAGRHWWECSYCDYDTRKLKK